MIETFFYLTAAVALGVAIGIGAVWALARRWAHGNRAGLFGSTRTDRDDQR